MLGHCELAVRRTQEVDHFDGDDIGRMRRLIAMVDRPTDDGVEVEQVPQQAGHIDAWTLAILGGNQLDITRSYSSKISCFRSME